MINELFENLPTEIAFMILTYRPNETALMIKKAIPYAHNFYCERPSQMERSLLTKFLKVKYLLRELGNRRDEYNKHLIEPYCDNSDDTFYDFFFDWMMPMYVSEGFYIMPESSKPQKVSVIPDDDDDE